MDPSALSLAQALEDAHASPANRADGVLDSVVDAQRRVAGLTEQMHRALETCSMRPVVEVLMALRGVSLITAMTVLAELGDISCPTTGPDLTTLLPTAALGLVKNPTCRRS